MKEIKLSIKGSSPLLMHRFPLEDVGKLEKKSKEEQAEIAAYREPNTGELYIPGLCLQRALIASAVFSKGKGRASLQKPVAACVGVSPEYMLLGKQEFGIDSRAVVVPSTKGRIIRHRPIFNEWGVEAVISYDEELITETQLRTIVDDAGVRVGLLDFRPACKGPYGRFTVVSWK